MDAYRERSGAVYHTRGQNAGTESLPPRDGVSDGGNKLKFVAAIANGRHAGGQIDRAPFHLFEVGMHVPQSRKDGLAPRIHNFRSCRHADLGARAYRGDSSMVDHNRCVRQSRMTGTVD